jgi:hypothetical protein
MCHMSRPSHSSPLDHPNNIGWSSSLCIFLISPLTSLLGLNILLNTSHIIYIFPVGV